jgi:translation elongation factor P/translation initiation factor 5A
MSFILCDRFLVVELKNGQTVASDGKPYRVQIAERWQTVVRTVISKVKPVHYLDGEAFDANLSMSLRDREAKKVCIYMFNG